MSSKNKEINYAAADPLMEVFGFKRVTKTLPEIIENTCDAIDIADEKVLREEFKSLIRAFQIEYIEGEEIPINHMFSDFCDRICEELKRE